MDDLGDMVKEFIVESNENLDRLDRTLVTLEKDPNSKELLDEIFRAVHTIKGATGFLGFSRLESVTHAGESLLSCVRDGAVALDPAVTGGLLAMVDAVREMLGRIEKSGADGGADYSALIQRLASLQARKAAPTWRETSDDVADVPPLGEILIKSGRVTRQQLTRALQRQGEGDPRRLGEILVAQGALPADALTEALETQKETQASALANSTIRVEVGQLDELMNLVGELVLVRNQMLRFSSHRKDKALQTMTQRLDRITSGLQERIMKTRMQPFQSVWSKFPRVVRDLAIFCGKKVTLEMEGQETKLDKAIIEAIKDPLLHIIRNAVDHGIESPELRIAAGKPAEGRLLIRAFDDGGEVSIEISDDGAGIDPQRLRRQAVKLGFITVKQAASLDERQALNLIFLPGFSMLEKVSSISGRGVGMDVVKTNIEKIGGSVEVHSVPGQGTKLTIKIPHPRPGGVSPSKLSDLTS